MRLDNSPIPNNQMLGIPNGLEEYQERFVANLRRLIGASYFRNPPHLRILDSGCDTSGRQLRRITELTRGEVVGINKAPGFPDAEAAATAGGRVILLPMDGTALDFPDSSFDLVVSANVMEHVSDPATYLRECCRVLKPGGIAYIETSPVWTSARGHHIHEDMVADNCPAESAYRNDGSVIPDWGHLSLSKEQMGTALRSRLRPETVDYIVHYLYETRDLNHTGWRAMRGAFDGAFPFVKITTWEAEGADSNTAPAAGADDYQVAGFAAVARKRRPQGLYHEISRRLIWRLRRAGV